MSELILPRDQYWSVPPEQLLAALNTTADGLSAAEAGRRLLTYGRNTLKARRRMTALPLFLSQFTSPLILILLFATGVSILVKEWVDAIIILIIILGSGLLSFIQEYSANTATERLRARLTVKATVLRDGVPRPLPTDEVVPGDVVLLSAGSLVPADGIVLEEKDIFLNQAALTGETFPVEKKPGVVPAEASLSERSNSVFMGTNVRSGSARVLIVRTGANTAFGQIAGRLTARTPESEFERGVRHFGYLLTEVTLLLLLIVFAVNVYFDKPVLDSLLFSLALAVGLTPELLPAIISINLSRGSQQMAASGVIVRRLASIENFGSMDVLCTDKAGTLTEGVVRLEGALDARGQPSDEVFFYAYLNAHFQTGLANPMDEAITGQAQPDIGAFRKVDELPYDFVRKRLTVVVAENEQRLLITKGAFEPMLAVCTHVVDSSGAQPLDEARRAALHRRYTEFSGQGLRVLGLALKSVPEQPAYRLADERGLAFVGFLLFFDPPKPDAQETIADLAQLGVQLKVITGDNHLVAQHTAQAIGLPVSSVLTGAKLNELHRDELWRAVQDATIFAEVDPSQKERIILALKQAGHVVGYMGDGINDAPALHAADVGISVDQAVDVAKEAADLVLLEKDLSVLHQGIVQGRTTFANTLKYVFITTSANFGNMFSMAGASLFLPFLPMLPKQVLLTNFLSDFPAIAIAGDNVDREFLQRPHRWNIRFIRDFMVTFGVVSSLFDYLTFAVLMFALPATMAQFRTGWFLESVITELLILLVVRTRRPFFKSKPGKYLWLAALAVAVVTVLLPYLPLNWLLGLTPLPAPLLLALVGITILYVAASEIVKRAFFARKRL
ncbi:MAG: magnesium-translocating P-type ATPase [Anaerolineae bacterium]